MSPLTAEAPQIPLELSPRNIRRLSLARVAWPLASVLLTIALAAARLLWNPRFYFYDDTQAGTIGQWYELGGRLLAGDWPMLNPHVWTAGNYLAEGQWGLYNPMIWILAISSHVAADQLVFVTSVKILFLGVLAAGVYLLSRSFGASRPWAAVAGVLAPMGGFTVYMDAASWTTGLLAAALFPFVWWGLRRLVDHHKSPLAYLISVYLLVTLGYVFGVIMLIVLLGEALGRSIIRRRWRDARVVLLAGSFGALLTITVYLPAVLTASVTERAGFEIWNTGFLNADLSDMAGMATPTATVSIGSWSGGITDAPLQYVAWVLPAAIMMLPLASRSIRLLVPLFVVGFVTLAIVVGPSDVGPIRWPIRFMPYLVIVLVVIFAVVATQGYPRQVARRRFIAAAATLAVVSWLAWVHAPDQTNRIGLVFVIQLAAFAVLFALAKRPHRMKIDTRSALAACVVLVVTAMLMIPQMRVFPGSTLPNFATPGRTAELTAVLDAGVNDAIVVGDVYDEGGTPETFRERLIANVWYFSETTVSSTYTVLPFSNYTNDLCTDLRGSSCAGALEVLFSVDRASQRPVADLLGVNTIVVIKASFDGILPEIADGWTVAENGHNTWVLLRDSPVATAGGIVWTGEGTTVEVLAETDSGVTFKVSTVGDDSRVAFSRLAWPGYTTSAGEIAQPLRGYLLTADMAGVTAGEVVTMQFRPPGWALEVAALIVAVMLAVGWALWPALWRWRRPGSHTA